MNVIYIGTILMRLAKRIGGQLLKFFLIESFYKEIVNIFIKRSDYLKHC